MNALNLAKLPVSADDLSFNAMSALEKIAAEALAAGHEYAAAYFYQQALTIRHKSPKLDWAGVSKDRQEWLSLLKASIS